MKCACAVLLCGLPSSTIFFPHYLINGTILETKIEQKYVFQVSLQLLSDIFFILRIIVRDMIENVCWS
jgi:hypothetical protein